MGNDKLYEASRRGVISEKTYREILKYKERLQKNGVPVIYNLRHVRKIFQIRRKEQELFLVHKERRYIINLKYQKNQEVKEQLKLRVTALKKFSDG